MKSVARARSAVIVQIVATMLLAGCVHGASEPAIRIVAAGGSERANLQVEIADTELKREVGLMYRERLDENAGMIFIFPEASHQSFWMKNTRIPLDMIFADAKGKIVGIVAEAEPFTETPRDVQGDSQYVLEVNGGFCKRHQVASGDRLEFHGFDPRAR